jgi:uncharacterized protein (DUF1778 family)
LASPPKTIRVTPDEDRCLRKARQVLDLPLSQLVQAAVTEAAHKLGFFADVPELATKPKKPWPDVPSRREESATKRISISIDPLTTDLLERASSHLAVGESLFILGATFRFLANLRAAHPEDRHLRSLIVPQKYGSAD